MSQQPNLRVLVHCFVLSLHPHACIGTKLLRELYFLCLLHCSCMWMLSRVTQRRDSDLGLAQKCSSRSCGSGESMTDLQAEECRYCIKKTALCDLTYTMQELKCRNLCNEAFYNVQFSGTIACTRSEQSAPATRKFLLVVFKTRLFSPPG